VPFAGNNGINVIFQSTFSISLFPINFSLLFKSTIKTVLMAGYQRRSSCARASKMSDQNLGVSLNGITLHVKNVEASLAFYKRIPGAQVLVHRPNTFAMLRIGQSRLGLLQWPQPTFHLEFDSLDLDATKAALRQAGFEPQSHPQIRSWGADDFVITDPDGNIVEFGLNEKGRGSTPPRLSEQG